MNAKGVPNECLPNLDAFVCSALLGVRRAETIFVFGEEIHSVTQPVIRNGVVVITDGKIQAVGPAAMVGDQKADRVIRTFGGGSGSSTREPPLA